ncbi:endonuclease [Bythopirellula goksoeyrii]|uniref:endonuclease n=1 Tax=Bythopirellula goksoeyrii TaxID=1400387 RepID=UPI00143E0356|nr:endonuclease [Bythopirellula goksoeyrii]
MLLLLVSQQAAAAPYDPPATYYNSATGTGATLKSQLRTIISNMDGVSYGDARYSAPYTDQDPNNANNILLIYNRASVDGEWETSPLIWNREHIWPSSRLGVGSPSNGTTNIASDQFNLRPSDDGINSDRGNDPFGFDTTIGGYGPVGSYWYPGDADIGDVARAQFYMATRYTQLSLTDSFPSGEQMGDLSSLVAWHYRDVPDDFERRRNHAIYGLAGDGAPAINNPYRQENRNPYVDHPEYVWSVFKDQQNDSQLYVGASPSANGSSSQDVNLGSVLVGASVPSSQNVTLHKNGLDGTYYEVTPTGAATSSVSGRYNAFPILTSGTSSKNLSVGLNTTTATAGLRSGSIAIDNLDITTSGGSGRGANDGNDSINVTLSVLDHANPSFELASDINTLALDFGTVSMGSMAPTLDFDIANLVSTASFTAGLDLDSIVPAGDSSVLSTDLTTFTGASALDAGLTNSFTAMLDTSAVGMFSASYTLNFSDEDLAGAIGLGSLTLSLTGNVEAAFVESADFDEDGDIDGADFLIWQRGFGMGTSLATGDANNDMVVDGADLAIWQDQYGSLPESLVSAAAVPEPTAMALLALACLSLTQFGRGRFSEPENDCS